ncbi:uncharacterized protein DAT39_014153 [Clarias magur]|uniref:Uncharacterized protein n=1 Tax=Clarias magur TaxID=1594786 RepID=A0A8J4TEX3_CLAMG|nr:uncharacterized protein DAT39_014153 [Clarias magur]
MPTDSDCLVLMELFDHGTEMDHENLTALTFVFLFLIALFYSIGVTVIKVLGSIPDLLCSCGKET